MKVIGSIWLYVFTITSLFNLHLGAMQSSTTSTNEKKSEQQIILAQAPQPPLSRLQLRQAPSKQCDCCHCPCIGSCFRIGVKCCDDQCIPSQEVCCSKLSNHFATRMEQKMAENGNYCPALCCLTLASLAGACWVDSIILCNDCCTRLAACCNGNDVETEVHEVLQSEIERCKLQLQDISGVEQFRQACVYLAKTYLKEKIDVSNDDLECKRAEICRDLNKIVIRYRKKMKRFTENKQERKKDQ